MIQADGTRESYLHDAEGRLLEHTDPLIGHYGRHERDAQRSCLMMVFRRAVFFVTGQVLMNRRQSDGGIFCLEMKTAN